ncbi:DUF2570 domain-containing protein [Klebsiella pneumoniae]|uniref:DUF2570 domain-containing protein n=1 Tax=Klebsiella pneumoniae TaxID=573 RepID=UPI00203BA44B|nr:DUF2570 domain-containing protein [Klebsiella pneumoniae]MDE9195206.1 DUF2570 domain-containing protein [Klebsiella pneumoniae]USB57185.1 DUF2570 domain-containing protein [Klebsiella pneumoniae]
MKTLIAFITTICILLAVTCIRLSTETSRREAAEKALADTTQKLNQTSDVLAEVRALRQDVSEIEASVKALGQKRNEAGEKRRENIKTELAGDPCAVALVPDAVADSLYQRATEVAAGDHSGAFAGKSDGKN